MNKLHMLALLAAGWCSLTACAAEENKAPNVVVILADDLGYGDMGCTGSRQVPTPNIDRLAEQGCYCERAYVAAPMCAPSRMALMTGRQPKRYGITANPNWKDPAIDESQYGLPGEEKLIPQYLSPLGYKSAAVGKWHLGHTAGQRPAERGFDVWWGFLGGSRNYFPMAREEGGLNPSKILSTYDQNPKVTYLTDDITREAVRFIRDQKKGSPFFLYVAYNAPHWPLESLPQDREAVKKHVKGEKLGANRMHYCAMVYAMDRGIGEIMEALQEQGLDDNTWIFFASDNGGEPKPYVCNAPWRGHKRLHYDGGVHVPLIVSRPGDAKKPGQRCNAVVSLMDILPTILELNGQKAPDNLDGRSMLGALNGEPAQPRTLHWCTDRTSAILKDDWKLLCADGFEPRLFDLGKDSTESSNCSGNDKARTRAMQKELDNYLKSTPGPRYLDNEAWSKNLLREHKKAEMSLSPERCPGCK